MIMSGNDTIQLFVILRGGCLGGYMKCSRTLAWSTMKSWWEWRMSYNRDNEKCLIGGTLEEPGMAVLFVEIASMYIVEDVPSPQDRIAAAVEKCHAIPHGDEWKNGGA